MCGRGHTTEPLITSAHASRGHDADRRHVLALDGFGDGS